MVDYSKAAEALVERRTNYALDNEKRIHNGELNTDSYSMINRMTEFDRKNTTFVAKYMSERGSKLFTNENTERDLVDAARKDGFLVQKDGYLSYKSGELYQEGSLYEYACGVAGQHMEMNHPEKMTQFYNAGDATKQAAFAMKTAEGAENDWQAIRNNNMISIYDNNAPDKFASAKHYAQEGGKITELTHEEYLARTPAIRETVTLGKVTKEGNDFVLQGGTKINIPDANKNMQIRHMTMNRTKTMQQGGI
ncbi:MAG: hypothetical protein IKK52_05740 [Alphaproteobacteria bacterium]|nr:hypothetical protein [Alphaproteobacteria bacterium]